MLCMSIFCREMATRIPRISRKLVFRTVVVSTTVVLAIALYVHGRIARGDITADYLFDAYICVKWTWGEPCDSCGALEDPESGERFSNHFVTDVSGAVANCYDGRVNVSDITFPDEVCDDRIDLGSGNCDVTVASLAADILINALDSDELLTLRMSQGSGVWIVYYFTPVLLLICLVIGCVTSGNDGGWTDTAIDGHETGTGPGDGGVTVDELSSDPSNYGENPSPDISSIIG